jgi:hypothetical protein
MTSGQTRHTPAMLQRVDLAFAIYASHTDRATIRWRRRSEVAISGTREMTNFRINK